MINDSIRYQDKQLTCDGVLARDVVANCGTPAYIYSLPRVLANHQRIRAAFSALDVHVHYSIKANGNLALLRSLADAGAGFDAVSGGEIFRALNAGARPIDIVFAGVGKTRDELRYAIEQGVGWFNVENVDECRIINDLVTEVGSEPVWTALRLNPDVAANTHPHIATGHAGAKFGLSSDAIQYLLAHRDSYPNLRFAGIHLHIGSQLHDLDATRAAVQIARDLIQPFPDIRTLNIGGGIPVPYSRDDVMPDVETFAAVLQPLLKDYRVLLEPGRSIIADAGILVTEVLYTKEQGGKYIVIVDASMSELIRPALYKAHHDIIPLTESDAETRICQVVGPVCETADYLGLEIPLSPVQPGDLLAIMTTGAYGMVMSSNYNARPRPVEVVVEPDGESWQIARRRETWADLLRYEGDVLGSTAEG